MTVSARPCWHAGLHTRHGRRSPSRFSAGGAGGKRVRGGHTSALAREHDAPRASASPPCLQACTCAAAPVSAGVGDGAAASASQFHPSRVMAAAMRHPSRIRAHLEPLPSSLYYHVLALPHFLCGARRPTAHDLRGDISRR